MNSAETLQAAALASIGKTPEQLEADKKAKELAEKQAKWQKLVDQANAADPQQCQGRVYRSGAWHSYRCQKSAKFHREEHVETRESPVVTRHYCSLHDDITIKAKQEAKWKQEREASDAKFKRDEIIRARQSLKDTLCASLSNAQIVKLTELLQDPYVQKYLNKVK